MNPEQLSSRNSEGGALEAIESAIASFQRGELDGWELDLVRRRIVALSEQQPSVAVADMEIIGHREPGDAHKGRAWWSGGTWLQPGEVVAVLTLPKQDERDE